MIYVITYAMYISMLQEIVITIFTQNTWRKLIFHLNTSNTLHWADNDNYPFLYIFLSLPNAWTSLLSKASCKNPVVSASTWPCICLELWYIRHWLMTRRVHTGSCAWDRAHHRRPTPTSSRILWCKAIYCEEDLFAQRKISSLHP